jgi:DNA-binding transcriptional MerR regulator
MAAPNRKSAKSGNSKHRSASDIVIPDKLYFRIGEVAKLCDLPTYVLRFWETEFPMLAPKKSSTGQRLYRQRDVENVVRIKKLLYEEGFTIAGARQQLKTESKPTRNQAALPFVVHHNRKDGLKQLRATVHEMLTMLSKKR